ncbi:hypothetical protein [Serratia sp. OS31]|uniref:hypothetical protein n=1 Tax=Serratia sp. OS31 TaxID=2760844 RepID=UPI0015FFF154|nr:hypothetical protein [Serratia sp. OS31]MBB1582010.1 hypothetical protein [Serratia sp. OS31]
MSCLEGENCIPSYSLRHIAENYWQQEYVAVGIRLPAHGTVPGVLTDIEWRDWPAVTRLAVRAVAVKPGAISRWA